MSDKTLGQVAFEAHHRTLTHSNRTTPWNSSAAQDAWQAAAEAVIEHYLTTETEAPLDFIKYRHEVRAVIEAAKAWWADIKAGDYYYPVDSIGKAVEALQEVEGE